MNKWTQDESIAFECARECINDLFAIYSSEIAEENAKAQPDIDKLVSLRAERSKLAKERASLRLHDHADIARIRADYGTIIRARRMVSTR